MPQFISKRRVILLAYLGQFVLSVSQFVTVEVTGDNSSHVEGPSRFVEVKIGFLVGSRRLDHDHTYSRPGRQLKYALNYAIDKFNQFNSDVAHYDADDRRQTKETNYDDDLSSWRHHDDGGPATQTATMASPSSSSSSASSGRRVVGGDGGFKIRLRPIIKETYGSESESIKQTIELITKHGVNFILGPQETCQIEPKLASVFNVAMLSHYCTTWAHASAGAAPNVDHEDRGHANQRIKLQSDAGDVSGGGGVDGHQSKSAPMTATHKQQQPQRPQRQTFIQIKPPHWKIVSRVMTLVEQLLAVSYRSDNNGSQRTLYPQQLVLLYFKEQPSSSPSPLKSKQASALHQPHELPAKSSDGKDASAAANDAYQYRLIGELLEIELNQLIATSQTGAGAQERRRWRRPTLSALNWHTTFHYGYTRNPFRAVLRRHLFRAQRQHQSLIANQSSAGCNQSHNASDNDGRSRLSMPSADRPQRQFAPEPRASQQTEAIYIVVGHYYEHLGLMLALNELNLLPTTSSSVHDDQQQQQQAQESIQSSVGMTPPPLMMGRRSVVIGVDTEPYDERDDSVRFLRGLLMDSAVGGGGGGGGGTRTPSMQPVDDLDLDSISTLYRAYLGVVPAKPTHLTEFLDEMRSLYANETSSFSSLSAVDAGADSIHELPTPTATSNITEQQQQQQLQLSARLLQFIRLPVEAFHLYDAVMLLGLYLKDCLLKWGPNGLRECSQGNRTFEWFRGRDYVSHVTHNQSRFDSWAQADGSYNLITRRKQTPMMAPSSQQDDESNSNGASAALMLPIGYFSSASSSSSSQDAPNPSTIDRIELYLSSWDEVDPIWLPFWCHVRKDFTSNVCLHLFQAPARDANNNSSQQMDDNDDLNASDSNIIGSYPLLTIVVVVVISLVMLMLLALHLGHYCCSSRQSRKQRRASRFKDFNAGWFSDSDERNFLELIHKYLLAPEANLEAPLADGARDERCPNSPVLRREMLQLHCNMFAFPSCMFVHWLIAMHQLKEMLFKFKSNSDNSKATPTTGTGRDHGKLRAIIDKSINVIRSAAPPPPLSSPSIERQFFSIKHSGTNSLRLLLNKYRSINECLINLARLDHETVVQLHGVTMSCSVAMASTSRSVFLVLEQADRGNLRQALKLSTLLSCSKSSLHLTTSDGATKSGSFAQFKGSLIDSLIGDLLDGLEYLHKSIVGFHGDLRSTTCLVSYNWRLKLSGFHANHLRRSLGNYEQKLAAGSKPTTHFDQMIYSAPELIQNLPRRFTIQREAMQLADIYSFAFVAYELLSDGLEPWASCTTVRDSKLIVDRVKEDTSFRPSLSRLDLVTSHLMSGDSNNVQRAIRSCWSHSPERRPQSISLLRARLCPGRKQTMSTNELMRIYTKLIERSCYQQGKSSIIIKRRIRDLQLRHLPAHIVSRLCRKQPIGGQHFECVSFAMIRLVLADGDSSMDNQVENLNQFIGEMMSLVDKYQNHLHLMDSQADSLLRFMVYSGEPLRVSQECSIEPPVPSQATFPLIHHSQLVASFGLQLVDLAARLQAGGNSIQVRCGLHCGPVFGALLASDSSSVSTRGSVAVEAHHRGKNLARYLLIGPTMLVANMLEQTSQSQRIQISAEFRAQLLLAERLLPSMSLSTTAVTAPTSMRGPCMESRQGYVIIRREARIQPAKMFPRDSFAADFEAYWLLNGPRLTASQSLMLLTRSCDTPEGNQSDDNSQCDLHEEADQSDNDDDDDDWHHNHHWTHLPSV